MLPGIPPISMGGGSITGNNITGNDATLTRRIGNNIFCKMFTGLTGLISVETQAGFFCEKSVETIGARFWVSTPANGFYMF